MSDSDLQQAIDKLRSSPHYKKLAAYEPPFNPFEIAGVTHRELTHSSVLAWLLRDEANREFRQKFVAKIAAAKPELNLDLSVLKDPGDHRLKPKEVETEYSFEASKAGDNFATFDAGRFDVFMHFEFLKLVIGIEVKVNAGEGSEQVTKYQNFLCKKYPDSYNKVIVFLTPGGYPSETKNSVPSVHVLEMPWSNIASMIRNMRAALGNENDFRMQFSQHLEKHLTVNETEGQRLVRKLLSEGDSAETLAEIIDHESSLQGKVRELLSKGDNAKTLAKIIDNMPSLGDYSDQWKRIVARVCGVKEENSIEVKTYTTKDGLIKELKNCIPEWQNTGLIKELKICIPEWREAGLPFTLMLYKYQKASVRILLYKSDLKGSEAELKKFANHSNGVVNGEFSDSDALDGWNVWYPVLTKDEKKETPEHTLIDNIWSEDWEEKAEKRLREQIEGTGGLLEQINKWIETKGANKG